MCCVLVSVVNKFSAPGLELQSLQPCLLTMMSQLDYMTGMHPVQVSPAFDDYNVCILPSADH